MSKRDYELIAATVNRTGKDLDAAGFDIDATDTVLGHLTAEFADALAKTNPRFDRERFIAACIK